MAKNGEGTLGWLRERNRRRVLGVLRERGRISQADIARATGLSRTTVHTLVPEVCSGCREPLPAEASAGDPEPKRFQVAEIPPVVVNVTEYQAQGRVSAVGVSDDLTHVSSQVQGSGSRNYRVNIQLEFDRDRLTDIEGDCSCPMAFNCKHVAATLLEALSDEQPSKSLAPKNLALMPAPLTAKPAKTRKRLADEPQFCDRREIERGLRNRRDRDSPMEPALDAATGVDADPGQ